MSCFWPDGSIAAGLQPCNTTAGAVSGCCRVGDICLTNGFCFSTGSNVLIRRGCTDPTFNSSQCPEKCLTGQVSSGDEVMTPCAEYNYFCCGQDDAARNCCTTGNGTVLLAAATAILPAVTITYSNTLPATASPTSCSLASSTAASSTADNCESTKNTVPIGAAAGLGGALGVAIITVVILAMLWKKKANQVKEAKQRIKDLEPSELVSR